MTLKRPYRFLTPCICFRRDRARKSETLTRYRFRGLVTFSPRVHIQISLLFSSGFGKICSRRWGRPHLTTESSFANESLHRKLMGAQVPIPFSARFGLGAVIASRSDKSVLRPAAKRRYASGPRLIP